VVVEGAASSISRFISRMGPDWPTSRLSKLVIHICLKLMPYLFGLTKVNVKILCIILIANKEMSKK
jgi:hypothetical protein